MLDESLLDVFPVIVIDVHRCFSSLAKLDSVCDIIGRICSHWIYLRCLKGLGQASSGIKMEILLLIIM